jgi:hypothetical protein
MCLTCFTVMKAPEAGQRRKGWEIVSKLWEGDDAYVANVR